MSLLGGVLLLAAYGLLPPNGFPFYSPAGWSGWAGVACGVVGVCLVPGVWLAAVMPLGDGAAAKLASHLGLTLAWYAVSTVVVHSTLRVPPTAGVVVGVTVTVTVVACAGILPAEIGHPARRMARSILAAVAGAVSVHCGLFLAGWLGPGPVASAFLSAYLPLVIGGGLLALATTTAVGVRTPRESGAIADRRKLARIAATAATAMLLAVVAVVVGAQLWPTTQKQPPVLTVRQIPATGGSTVEFAIAGYGPGSTSLIDRASFRAFDDLGRPLPAGLQIADKNRSTSTATLRVSVDSGASQLCGPGGPGVKMTVRDMVSGTSVQGQLPAGWCGR